MSIFSQKPVEVLVFGAGAVGSVFGWRLTQNPHVRVSMLCRSNYRCVKQDGVKMKTQLWGNEDFRPHRVLQSTQEVQNVPFDYVVCASKGLQANEGIMIDSIREAIRPTTTLVSVQNGIHVEQPLKKAFPRNTILSAICYISCQQTSPGVVCQVARIRPHAFHVGLYSSGHVGTEVAFAKASALAKLDEKFRAIPDLNTERWIKMMFNGSCNPMTALTGYDTHQLLGKPHLSSLVHGLATEVYDVAVKSGANLPPDMAARTINAATDAVAMRPSMLQDVTNGRRMEIEPLCGNILRQANAVGVAVPMLEAVYDALLELDEEVHKDPCYASKRAEAPLIESEGNDVALPISINSLSSLVGVH